MANWLNESLKDWNQHTLCSCSLLPCSHIYYLPTLCRRYLGGHVCLMHPGPLSVRVEVGAGTVPLVAWRRLLLPQPIKGLLSPLDCCHGNRLLVLTCFGPILKR